MVKVERDHPIATFGVTGGKQKRQGLRSRDHPASTVPVDVALAAASGNLICMCLFSPCCTLHFDPG